MTDPNPYEPPRTPKGLTPTQAVKRTVGVWAILFATPPAGLVALVTSCGFMRALPSSWRPGERLYVLLPFALPLLVVLAMTCWAAWKERQHAPSHERNRRRVSLLVLTPLAVFLAILVGVVATSVFLSWETRIFGGPNSNLPYLIAFLILITPASITLLAMLWAAWLADRRNELTVAPRDSSGDR